MIVITLQKFQQKPKEHGGICGQLYGSSVITDCYNSGEITGTFRVGGIAGQSYNNTIITKSYNIGEINAEHYVGGIAGQSYNNPTIVECYNKGNVESTGTNEWGSSNTGGIVGMLDTGRIIDTYNVGNVKGVANNIGGIIGINRSYLANSYNFGKITGNGSFEGSITGYNQNYSEHTVGEIRNCYALEGMSSNLFGDNNSIVGPECSEKTSDELKALAPTLGDAFTQDTTNINNGYPILKWQLEE